MKKNRKVILISGSPCSGKTYFINNKLANPEFSKLIDLPSDYKVINANALRSKAYNYDSNISLVIHYDCMRSYKRGFEICSQNDPFLRFLENEHNVYVLIINTDINTLKRRLNERIIRLADNVSPLRQIKLNNLMSLYQDSELYEVELNKWFNYCLRQFKENQLFTIKSKGNKYKIEVLRQ